MKKLEKMEGQLDWLVATVPQLTVQLATVAARAVGAAQPATAILRVDQMVAESTTAPAVRERAPDRPRRMTPVKKFVVVGGDWGAFTRRFKAAYQAIGLTEKEALRALSTALDDDTVEVFRAVAEERRATCTIKGICALLALGQVVYPWLNKMVLQSLVMVKILVLAQDMGVMLPIVEETQTSCGWPDDCRRMRG
ncbi:unnamed protein product [Lampetra planeri]